MHSPEIPHDVRVPLPRATLAREPLRKEVRSSRSVLLIDDILISLDFHAGLLLASTIPSPTLFLVRNNGFAISTPSTEQFYGDGIAARGPGYGIDTVRVDGNDILAVLGAVREARRRCLHQGRAVLVEAMSYRYVAQPLLT